MLREETKDAIRRQVDRHPSKKTALLPSLKLAQSELGWLPDDAVKEVAALVGVPHSNATELATFYSMLFTEQPAKVRVEVCIQLPCALKGAEQTVTKLCDALGIESHGHHGGAAKDHSVEVHGTVECFGSCHRAPMCRLGEEYRENLDEKGLAALVDEIKKR